MKSVLRVENVVTRYGRKSVLDGVSFEIPESSTTVLLGPNGAGKSTLMRLVMGLEAARSGRVIVDGRDVARESRAVRECVGYVPDRPDVCPWMKLDEFYAFLRPQFPNWSDERALELADQLAIPRDQTFSTMSRGQSTKAMLAAAIAIQPSLLLLDEPFGTLDPAARDDVLRGVLSGIAERGCAVFVATHDLHVAARIADRVVMLDEGHVRANGTLDEVLGLQVEGNRVPERLRAVFDLETGERRLSA